MENILFMENMTKKELYKASESRNQYLLQRKQELERENFELKKNNASLLEQVEKLKERIK